MEFTVKVKLGDLNMGGGLEFMNRILGQLNQFINELEGTGCEVELTIHETTYQTPSGDSEEE